ncbi:MAG: hypothetical protein IIC35_06220 [Gemmatimonadetes bacterium]|nr:hypothetical protein [Gemmatimonadota bacterium]
MRTHLTVNAVAAIALVTAALAAPARAQLGNASASGLALSSNNTASVRGFAAISVNPAGLAMPGSGFSLALAPAQVRAGLGPVTLSDLAKFEGVVVPTATKELWLSAIEAAGGQTALVRADVSAFALTVGNLGLQVSTVGSAKMNLPVGAAEAILYGNAGRTGSASDLDLTGLDIDAFVMTTGALSWAFPVGRFKFGVTGKYIVGNGLGIVRSSSGSISSNPIRVTLDAPVVATCEDIVAGACTRDFAGGGKGYGLDLGFMMDLSSLTIGASIQNVVNTFGWDVATLSYREGSVLFEQGSSDADFTEASYGLAPTSLKQVVEEFTIKPNVRIGVALELPMGLTLTGDVHRRLSDHGIEFRPKSHAGVGVEFRGLKIVHLRGGAAVTTRGKQYSGGVSIVLGPINFSAATAVRQGGPFDDVVFGQFTISFGNR